MSTTQVQYVMSLKDQLSAGIDRANAAGQRLNGTMGGLQRMIAGTFSVVGISMFVKSMVEAGSKVEDAQTGLTTLLKNSKEAAQVITNTMEDATKTPFAFEGLLMANKALISAGVESQRARQDVLNLGNAIAATGGGDAELQRMVVNLQQISNTGKATALDIKQFAYAGVNIYRVLEEAGIKAEKGNRDQAISYGQITAALKQAHEIGGIYFQGLENMSGNTSVKISNLGDAIFQLKVKMFQDLKPAIEGVLTGLFKLIDHLKSGWEWINKHKEATKGMVIGLGTLAVALRTVVPLMTAFAGSTLAALGPVGALIATIGLATSAYMLYADSIERVSRAQQDNADRAKGQTIKGLEETSAMYVKNGMDVVAARSKVAKVARESYANDYKTAEREMNLAEARLGVLPKNSAFDETRSRLEGTIKDKQWLMKQFESQLVGVTEFENNGLVKTPGGAGAANGLSKVKSEKTKAVGSKSVTINVSIKDLIGTYNMNVTNIKEGAEKIKEAVVNALAGAINDFQVVAE